MNIQASIQARMRNLKAGHFELTKYGKQLMALKNTHAGERCFFIGNGPSLRAEDLTVLHENKEICFAFNRIYTIFEQTNWRPHYYLSQDDKMLQGCAEVVDGLLLPHKFIPINMKWYYDIQIHDAIWFEPIQVEPENLGQFFSDDIAHGVYVSNTVMYTAAQFAAYMGCKEIYLLGVDHHFRVSQNNKGEIVIDNSVKDYFSDKYNIDKENLYIPNTERSNYVYEAMKRQCENRGIRVFNATRGGKLEVFPRVDFDALLL